jgi:tRNA 2-thiouridine synthesizing protein A
MTAQLTIATTIDARGSHCPGPLMELIRGLREAEVGDLIAVLATDQASQTDIPRWAEKTGQRLVAVTSLDGYVEIVVEKVR